MHNNFYFLRQLSRELNARLKGTVISECFSQSKDELVIRFETPNQPFYIKASLLPNFSCLSFPENFQRARKNSVDLFELLIGQRLNAVHQFENERSFVLEFENAVKLLFKMHGNLSNIILFQNDEVVHLFKNSLLADNTIDLKTLDRSIDWSYENFINHQHDVKNLYFTFGKIIWNYLDDQGFSEKNINEKWKCIHEVIQRLEKPMYYISQIRSGLTLTLVPFGDIVQVHTNAIDAVTEFYYSYSQTSAFTKEKQSILSSLKTTLQNYESYITKTFTKLSELEGDNNYKIWADLIMANMHAIQPRMEKVTLSNFYNHDQPTEIKLKKDLSPQRNAEVFYRKSKNQHIELERLQKAIQDKEKEINTLRAKIETLESAADLKTLRNTITTLHLNNKKEKQPEVLPYHTFEFQGYKIWVGRNAQSNDQLTLKYSFKEDLWLHAKDVAGSHVLIKYQSGKIFPKDVIERAAQLAAYHSKRKNESLCPVVVTPKKFVRKRKGDPAGMMVVEREDVIMVEPRK